MRSNLIHALLLMVFASGCLDNSSSQRGSTKPAEPESTRFVEQADKSVSANVGRYTCKIPSDIANEVDLLPTRPDVRGYHRFTMRIRSGPEGELLSKYSSDIDLTLFSVLVELSPEFNFEDNAPLMSFEKEIEALQGESDFHSFGKLKRYVSSDYEHQRIYTTPHTTCTELSDDHHDVDLQMMTFSETFNATMGCRLHPVIDDKLPAVCMGGAPYGQMKMSISVGMRFDTEQCAAPLLLSLDYTKRLLERLSKIECELTSEEPSNYE